MERPTRKTYVDMSSAQMPVFDEIAGGRTGVSDGRIGGPFDIWMLSPEFAGLIDKLGKSFASIYLSTIDTSKSLFSLPARIGNRNTNVMRMSGWRERRVCSTR